MEGNTSIVKTNHPGFGKYFSSNVMEATREDPKKRIALLAAGFMNPQYIQVTKDSILCNRECCQVVSSIDVSRKSNRCIIRECLSSDNIYLRKNSAKVICHKLNDTDQRIKYMAKGILGEVFCEGNINYMAETRGHIDTYLWLFSTLILYGRSFFERRNELDSIICEIGKFLFHDRNINAILNNERFMSDLPLMLREMFRYENLIDNAAYITEMLFSNENIDAVLKNGDFMGQLPQTLKEMFDNSSLRGESNNIIKKIFSTKENIDVVWRCSDFAFGFASMLENMLNSEELKEEAKNITSNLLRNKDVSISFRCKLKMLLRDHGVKVEMIRKETNNIVYIVVQ